MLLVSAVLEILLMLFVCVVRYNQILNIDLSFCLISL